jgi:hypothetical protein
MKYGCVLVALMKTLSKSFVGRNDLLIKVKNKMVQVLPITYSAFDLVVSFAGLEGIGEDTVLMKEDLICIQKSSQRTRK